MSVSWRPNVLYSPWNSPGQNTGVGSFFLLQGIFPTQGLNPGLPHCRWILYQGSHKGNPKCSEHFHYSMVGQTHLTQRLFYNKVLNIWHVLLNTVLTVRNRMLVWVECLRYPGCLPLWVCGWWGASACCHCPAPQESFVPHIASIRRSKFKVWFLLSVNHFHKIVKSKNHSVEPSYVRYCMYIPRPAPGSYFHSPTC